MSFDGDAWVNDIVTGAFSGACAGVAIAMLIPDSSLVFAFATGGISGLVFGILAEPVKSVLRWIRGRRDND